jgi:hypothetical protein
MRQQSGKPGKKISLRQRCAKIADRSFQMVSNGRTFGIPCAGVGAVVLSAVSQTFALLQGFPFKDYTWF